MLEETPQYTKGGATHMSMASDRKLKQLGDKFITDYLPQQT